MNTNDKLSAMLEQLLAEEGPRDPAVSAAAAGAFFSARSEEISGADDPAAQMAAWLDGTLDGEARAAFEATLAKAPGALLDLEAAETLLARATPGLPVPADLMAELRTEAPAARVSPATRARQALAGIWKRPLWAGGGAAAAAAMAVLALAIIPRSPSPGLTDPGAPLSPFSTMSVTGEEADMAPAGQDYGNVAYAPPCASATAAASMTAPPETIPDATACDAEAQARAPADMPAIADTPASPAFAGSAPDMPHLTAEPER